MSFQLFNFNPNDAQVRNALVGASIFVNIWPRGQGKTFNLARKMIEVAHGLPYASSIFVGRTYKKLKRDIIPEITEALTKMGYLQDIHYVLYHKPDKSLDYPKPLKVPGEYENVITWYTGHTIYLLSQDHDISARGKSVNFVFADELLEIKQDKFEAEVGPANRGNDEFYKNVPLLNHGMYLCSSKPIGTTDQWILDYSKYYHEDKIDYTQTLKYLTDLEISFIDESNADRRRLIWKDIQKLMETVKWYPSVSKSSGEPIIFYNETRIWNNIKNLGWRYVMQQRRTMHDIRFRVEMLNQTIDKIENGFYPTFTNKNIYYDSYNYDFINTLPLIGMDEDCRWDSDHDVHLPINIGQDYGVSFNGITVSQRHGMELRYTNNFYVKEPLWIKDVVKLFTDYYKPHKNRIIYYDFDHTGHNRTPNGLPLAQQAMNMLQAAGWTVIMRSTATPIEPSDKYANHPLDPEPGLMYVTINGNRCKEMITSMRLSPVMKVKAGLAKDKSSESSKLIPQESATHLSDAHDFTLYNEYRTALTASSIPVIMFPSR